MTVTNTALARNEATGNASTTGFTYGFRILATSHLGVYLDGVKKALTTDYTVSGAGDAAGGTVTFNTAPASGVIVSIVREVPVTQATDYIENAKFSAVTHEDALDKLTMLVQQLDEEMGRALKFAVQSTREDFDVPDPAGSQFLRWNSSATKLENATGITTAGTLAIGPGDKRKPVTTGDGVVLKFGDDLVLAPAEQTGTAAFQCLEADLTIGAAFGVNTASAPIYGAAVMGNLIGTAGNTKTANILAGVIGKFDLQGTVSSTYPVAGIIGEIGDKTTGADAAVLAVLGGDSGVTTAPAAFGVDYLNSAPDSQFSYGLDLYKAAHDGYLAASYAQAAIRIPNAAWMKSRNAAGTADTNLLRLDASDRPVIGANAIPTAAGTVGDIWYVSAAGVLSRLAIGTANQRLSVVSGIPGWATLSAGLTGTGLTTIERVRKTANELVNNSTTLQNDDTLLVSLAASEVVHFLVHVIFDAAALADFKPSFTVPSGAAISWNVVSGIRSNTSQAFAVTAVVETSGNQDTTVGGSGVGTKLSVDLMGTVRNSTTTGNLQFQWAQAAADASDTTVYTDSYLLAFRE